MKKKFIPIILYFIGFSFVLAQNINVSDNNLVIVRTKLYESLVGTIIKENQDSLVVKTHQGEIRRFPHSEIQFIKPFDGRIRRGRVQRADPNSSYYLFSPSAFAIDSGRLFCKDFCLFYPSLNAGILNIISLQGGMFWLPGQGLNKVPFIGNVKITPFQSSIFTIAGGAMYVHIPDIKLEKIFSSGFGFVTGTIGDRYNHLSISWGWGYLWSEERWELMEKPIIVAAGNIRILDSVSLISENWVFPDRELDDSLMTLALRFFGRQMAVDVGATFTANSIKQKEWPIPVVNVIYHLR